MNASYYNHPTMLYYHTRFFGNLISRFILRLSVLLFGYLLFVDFCYISENYNPAIVSATSINYGVNELPITDVNQLMPKLCQSQSAICEGVICIPDIRRCDCDLRMPVQFDKFCLRQVDIDTKCFATKQCNHTVKEAVCIDINSNAVLDVEASKFKLEQWQQLNELRSQSGSRAGSNSATGKQRAFVSGSLGIPSRRILSMGSFDGRLIETQDSVMYSSARNSPYEINYNTNDLLVQNHTRRKINSTERIPDAVEIPSSSKVSNDPQLATQTIPNPDQNNPITPKVRIEQVSSSTIATSRSESLATVINQQPNEGVDSTTSVSEATDNPATTLLPGPTTTSDLSSRKMITKTPHWPPGICSCPFGYMFDSMLRKCLAKSLNDSHCLVDSDCKYIPLTHCSIETKKCACDEPFVWDQKDLACLRPKQMKKDEPIDGSVVDNSLLPTSITSKLFLENSNLIYLLLILFFIITATLIILESTVKCFSSKNSALISPKRQQKKQRSNSGAPNNVGPKSPYATLRKSDQPNSQLSNFTQATRGRILNYDFEQDSPKTETAPSLANNTLKITFLFLI